MWEEEEEEEEEEEGGRGKGEMKQSSFWIFRVGVDVFHFYSPTIDLMDPSAHLHTDPPHLHTPNRS